MNNINEFDITKKMLNTIRNKTTQIQESKSKRFLMEQEEQPEEIEQNGVEQDNDEVTNINDVDIRTFSDNNNLEINDTERNTISGLIDSFRDQVSQIVELDPGFTIKEGQIRLDGNYHDYDLKFVLISGNDSGIYITTEMSQMDEDLLGFLDKLQKFEITFKEITEPLIRERGQ